MAVYTHISSEALGAFLARYDVGDLVSAKGIAEGVENSNYMVDTTKGRYFLTLYEKRVASADLPFFQALLERLWAGGCPVPRMLPDRTGTTIQVLADRPACLIEFLPGVSPSHPTPNQARAVGAAMADMHAAVAEAALERPNQLGPADWQALFTSCADQLDTIEPGLRARVSRSLADVVTRWPSDLPRSIIHADLFPDNVLMLDDSVTGLIDFYFACTDIRAYDVAVMHTSWAFDATGGTYDASVGAAVIAGYRSRGDLSDAEVATLPVLARGACLRFLLTRAYDWVNTPAGAHVTRKDPLAYRRRLDAYEERNLFA
ncbi:MAG: homoserine kinase [Pseudomonadota bacterium]|nr:homoserine kinase [Pseudomonadota bacterium]